MKSLRDLFKREPQTIEMGPLYPQVRDAIQDIQAYARSHGGEIQLMGVTEEGEVKIKLRGACNGCPLSDVTLKRGIEDQLKQLVPGVEKVSQIA